MVTKMKLTEHVYLIGSGGMGLSAPGDCNVYAVADGKDILLIDCGLNPDPEKLLSNLEKDGLNPRNIRGVILTHVHADHVGALPAFRERGIPILASQEGGRVLQQGVRAYYQMEQLPPSGFWDFFCGAPVLEADALLSAWQEMAVGRQSLIVIPTPGHSPDSVCFLLREKGKKYLFTGDTLFYPGQINYFAGPLSRIDAYPSTIRTLAELKPDGLFPGHAMFTVDRGWLSTDSALACIESGTLPPMKSYS